MKTHYDKEAASGFSVCMISSFLLLLAVLLLSGCIRVTPEYQGGGQFSRSKEQALQSIADEINALLGCITPTQTPVHRTALVAVPSREQIEQQSTTEYRKKMLFGLYRSRNSAADMDYMNAVGVMMNECMFKAIEKRQIFDQVVLVLDPAPQNVPVKNVDFVIFHNVADAEWYIKGGNLAEPRLLPLDKRKAGGVPRILAWLDSLEQTARVVSSK
jgi:hypothetical protein